MTREIIARIKKAGKKFEILIDQEKYVQYREGKISDLADVLIGDSIFTDLKAATRASEEELKKAFGTTDFLSIAKTIIKEGEVQITAEERQKLVEEKRKRIISLISRRCIDPQTGKPHPMQRIEIAMEQAKVRIDPFKGVEEQYKEVVDALKKILPLRSERRIYAFKVPLNYGAKARIVFMEIGDLKREEWTSTSYLAEVEIMAAMEDELFSKINAITHGEVESKLLRKEM